MLNMCINNMQHPLCNYGISYRVVGQCRKDHRLNVPACKNLIITFLANYESWDQFYPCLSTITVLRFFNAAQITRLAIMQKDKKQYTK